MAYYRQITMPDAPSVFTSKYHFLAVQKFLCAIERMEPKVLSGLLKMCSLCDKPDVLNAFWKGQGSSVWSQLHIADSLNCRKLRNELIEWATKYNLLDEHALYLEIGSQVLAEYLSRKDLSKVFLSDEDADTMARESISLRDGITLADGTGQDVGLSVMFPFEFTYEQEFYGFGMRPTGWDPRDDWKEFEGRLNQAFEDYKEAYRAKVQAYVKANGFEPVSRKDELKHFEWFVMYQIQEMSQSDIVKHLESKGVKIKGQDRTISKGIHGVSDVVLLPLRDPSKGGRPRK